MRAITIPLACMIAAACAPVTSSLPTPSELPPIPGEKEPVVEYARPVQMLMQALQLRMVGHATLPDAEIVLCLYGRVSRDTIYVERTSEADYRETTNVDDGVASMGAMYWPCEGDDYIGAYHNHPAGPWGDGCWHSKRDVDAFMLHTREIVQVVSCTRDGQVLLSSRVKRGYSQRS